MAACPAGHESSASDFCDVCGVRLDAPPTPSSTHDLGTLVAEESPNPDSPCPRCGLAGLGRFCEACGFATPAATWTVTVTASRSHYDDVMATADPSAKVLMFPADWPKRTFQLSGTQMLIGRQSNSKEVSPEIDLSGSPGDPGISRLHAVLIAQPDGSWAVVDPGSENGTTVNGAEIPFGQPVLLNDGDYVCIGAWTAITIKAPAAARPDD